jgi:hypothetical protein
MLLLTLLSIATLERPFSWLAVQQTTNSLFGHNVFRDLGGIVPSFLSCVAQDVSRECSLGIDPDCIAFAGMKTFINQQSTKLAGFSWSSSDGVRTLIPGSERLYFVVPWAITSLYYLNSLERATAIPFDLADASRHLFRLGALSSLPNSLTKECVKEGSQLQQLLDHEKTLPIVPPPPPSPPPLPPPPPIQITIIDECNALYPDYEICNTQQSISKLTRCTQHERSCRPLSSKKQQQYECTCR